MSAALIPHGPVDDGRTAGAVVAALGLPAADGGFGAPDGRPVVVAATIAAIRRSGDHLFMHDAAAP